MAEKKTKSKQPKKISAKPAAKPKPKAKLVEKKPKSASGYIPSYKARYHGSIISNMIRQFQYKSPSQVPRLVKITLNMGIGDAKNNPKALESGLEVLKLISGQKAVVTHSRKDISNFKIRKGFPVGCMVTLRANRMYEFFERLNSIALPRTRDFNGLSFKSFDGHGNYSFGINEQIIFTEIDYDKIDAIRGLNITITTTANTADEAYWLLKEFGFPLREKPIKKDVTAEAA